MATRYRICVRGHLDPSWSDRMAGLQITVTHDPEGVLTTLEGPIRDQPELSGVLDTLSDLGLTLLSVESPREPRDGDPPANEPSLRGWPRDRTRV